MKKIKTMIRMAMCMVVLLNCTMAMHALEADYYAQDSKLASARNGRKIKESIDIKIFALKGLKLFKGSGKTFIIIEHSRLIHIIPEAFNSKVCKIFIL